MTNLNLTIQEEIQLLKQFNITPNDLFIFRMLIMYKDGEPSYLRDYLSNTTDGIHIFKGCLIRLRNSGLLNKSSKLPKDGETKSLDDVVFDLDLSVNAQKKFFKFSFDLGMELLSVYPNEIWVNNTSYKAKRYSKKFDSPEAFCAAYAKYIKYNLDTHKHILQLIEWGKSNDYSFTTIGDFVVDMDWMNLQIFMDNNCSNGGLDTMTVL